MSNAGFRYPFMMGIHKYKNGDYRYIKNECSKKENKIESHPHSTTDPKQALPLTVV